MAIPSPRPATRRARVVVGAYKAAGAVVQALPDSAARALGRAGGSALYAALPGKRALVARHQRRIAGAHLTGTPLRRQVRRAFRSYGEDLVAAFRLPAVRRDVLAVAVEPNGLEHLDAGLAAGNGVVMAMPHLGAWDVGGAWLALRYPLTVVAERLEPPELFDWFTTLRAGQGIEVVPLGPDAGSRLLRALRDNRVLGLLCDRDIGGGGVEVEFFGEKTTLPAGPATFALRTGAPLLPNAAVRGPDGRLQAIIRPPLPVERSGGLRADVARLTQQLAWAFEELISAYPDQWHVQQPNWPSDRAAP